LFSEVGAGAFLVMGLCLAFYETPYASSIALGISILFRPTNVFALPIWGKAVWRKGPLAVGSGLIIIGAGLAFAAFNYLRFGSVLNFGYGEERFDGALFQNLYGILLSPGRSPFVY